MRIITLQVCALTPYHHLASSLCTVTPNHHLHQVCALWPRTITFTKSVQQHSNLLQGYQAQHYFRCCCTSSRPACTPKH